MKQKDDPQSAAPQEPPFQDDRPLPIYPDAPQSLIASWQHRRKPLSFHEGEALPPLDCDLDAFRDEILSAPQPLGNHASGYAHKRADIQQEFTGKSALCALNGLLIATLRKREFPAHTPALFHRIWREQGTFLLENLPTRWLISSIITFGDHGRTEEQRSLGQMMNVLFSLMKLYEYERLYSRTPAAQPFGLRMTRRRGLPLDMPGFSLLDGGLDINLLAPIWQKAQAEPLAGPIASLLLDRLNMEKRGIFRRLDMMRDAQQDEQAQKRLESLLEPPKEA